MISSKKLLSCVSLTALTLSLHAQPALAVNSSGFVTLDTGIVINNGFGVNPTNNGANGSGVPSVAVTGSGNATTVTFSGTMTGANTSSGIYILGNNSHGASDLTTSVAILGGTTATSGPTGGANTAAVLLDISSGILNLTNSGTLIGAGGQSALLEAAQMNGATNNGGNIVFTNTGSLTATGAAPTINMVAASAGNDRIQINGGSFTQTGTASAINLANNVSTADIININGGTISAASATGNVINVSGTTGAGATTITIAGGTLTNLAGSTGQAIALGHIGDTVTITGGTIQGAIFTTLNNTGSVTFNDAAGFTQNGGLGGSPTGNLLNAITVTGGTLTLNNSFATTTLGFNGGTTILANNDAGSAGTINFGGGTLALGTNTLSVGATTLTSSAGPSTISIALGTTSNGKISSSAAITNSLATGGQTVTITPIVQDSNVTTGNNEFVILHGTTSTTNLSTAASNGGLVVWSLSGSTTGTDAYGTAITGNNVVLNDTVLNAHALPGVTNNEGNVINSGVSIGAPTQVKTALLALNSAPQVALAGARLSPETNGGSIAGSQASVDGVLNTVANRLDALRGGPAMSGYSSGEGVENLGLWVQAFGGSASQDNRADAAGYNVYGGGMAIGADKMVVKNVRLGASVAYARNQVNDTGVLDGNDMSINSYLGTLYGSYQGAPWYVDGALDFGYHHYSTTRLVNFTGFNDTANGAHQGYQYTAKTIAGYPIQLNPVTVTPILGFTYSHLDQTGYTENSAAGSGLRVGGQGNDSYKTGLGAKVSETFKTEGFKLTPEFTAAWEHEFNDTGLQSSSGFAAGGSSFTTTEIRPSADTAVVGLNLTAKTQDDISLTASYTAEVRSGYLGNTGILNLRKDF